MTGHQPFGDAVHEQRDWLRVTLYSIGDAVITTDTDSNVTFLNPVAEKLTGWTQAEADGVPLESVFRIINQDTRKTVESPTVRALRDGVIVGLANHTLLISKDGTERPIDDSAAPIRNERNDVAGVVLVFRDISERYAQERTIQDTLNYANNIIATLREPFLIITGDLRVHTANRSFYENFQVSKEETEGRYIHNLGNGQWNIPNLRSVLTKVLSEDHPVSNYQMEHNFPKIGPRSMVLNALRVRKPGNNSDLILLAIEDITERKRAETAVRISEVRYRRLFESAQDGILILDFDTGTIKDANQFMCDLLGYSHKQFLGKELWEIGLFSDRSISEATMRELQEKGYVRYENLPLKPTNGRQVEVEVIGNSYIEGEHKVIQCNIRDITERVLMEKEGARTS